MTAPVDQRKAGAGDDDPKEAILEEHKLDIDPPLVLSSVQAAMPSFSKDAKFGTVDPTWDKVGFPRVAFDGEINISQKTYKYIGAKPAPGARVVLEPMSGTYVITGAIGVTTIPKVLQMYSISVPGTPTAQTGNDITIATALIPDPGWPYKLFGEASAYYALQFVNNFWGLSARLDSPTGLKLSQYGFGYEFGITLTLGRQANSWPIETVPTILTGAHNIYLTLHRLDTGSGSITSVQGGSFSGFTVFQVPA